MGQFFDSKRDFLIGTASAPEEIPPSGALSTREENTMFGWAITFLIVAIVAGIFGFAGVVGTATWIAKVLFVVGLVVFLVLLVSGRSPPTT
jgi:uncharacterized membrane protein YtjA (UPF0391 family)